MDFDAEVPAGRTRDDQLALATAQHRDGGVVNVEGSATDAELTRPTAAGTLAHTNHYACERMLRYEGDPAYAKRSAVRLGRAL